MHREGRAQGMPSATMQTQPRLVPRRIALVARDWLQETTSGPGKFRDSNMGFAPHFAEIANVASRHGADALLFCLWSHDARKLGELSPGLLFPRGTRHQAVILGVKRSVGEDVEVHFRSQRSPATLRQQFARTSDRAALKEALLSELSARQFGSTLIPLCGETNLIKTERRTRAIVDQYEFLPWLRAARVQLVLNPIHDYMRRFEMVLKRQALARAAHTVVCVWNRGCRDGSESALPWAAYRQGRTITDRIQEVDSIALEPGVRIGVLDMA